MAISRSKFHELYKSMTENNGSTLDDKINASKRAREKEESVNNRRNALIQQVDNRLSERNADNLPNNTQDNRFDYDTVSKQDDFINTAIKGYRSADNKIRTAVEAEPELKKFSGAEEAYNAGYDLRKIDRTLSAATQKQKALYNYYIGSGNSDLAEEYLESIYQDIQKQYNQGYSEEMREFAKEHPVVGSAASAISNIVKPLGISEDLMRYMKGAELNENSKLHVGTLATDSFRSGVKENIDSGIGEFLYDTAMSGVDSLAVAPLGGAGAVLLGLNAASDALYDAKERGATDTQAIKQGLAQGIAEGLFEKVSLGNLKSLKDVPVNTVRDVVMNTAKSIGVNASEEAFTEIANSITDSLIMGENSNYNTLKNYYKAARFSDKEAEKNALTDTINQIFMSGLGGALMGGAFSAVGHGANYLKTSSLGRNMSDSDVNSFINSGLNMPDTDSYMLAADLMERKESGTGISNYKNGNLAKNVLRDTERIKKSDNNTSMSGQHGSVQSESFNGTQVENQPAESNVTEMQEQNRVLTEEEQNELDKNYIRDFKQYYDQYGAEEMESEWNRYKGKIGADQYEDGFSSAYAAGLSGASIPSTVNTSLLSKETLQIAYNSGMQDAIVKKSKVNTDGISKFVTMQQDGGGIVESDSAKAMMETDRDQFDAVDAISKAVGIKVDIVDTLGDANGFIKDGRITIARDTTLSASTVLKHELTHAMQEYSPEAYSEYKKFVVSSILEYDKSGLDTAVSNCIKRYAENDINLTYDEAFDELVSDASERFLNDEVSIRQFVSTLKESDRSFVQKIVDFFKELVDKLTKAISDADPRTRAGELLNESLVTAKKAEKLWQQGLADMGRESVEERKVKYSLRKTVDNRMVAFVDEDILAGVQRSEWTKVVKKALESREIKVPNDVIMVNAITRNEYTNSKYTEWLRRNENGKYIDKLRIADSIEDVIAASVDYVNEEHVHHNFRSFARGNVLLQSGTNQYKAEVVVGINAANKMVLYDLVNITPTQFTLKKEESVKSVKPNGNHSERTDSSNDSISQPEGNGNTKYSLKDTSEVDVKKLQQENEHLKELNENLRAQFRLTKEFAPSRKELTSAAKRILTDYNSNYDLDTLVDNMESIYKYIANNQIDSEESMEITNAFASIAKKVLEKSGQLDTSLYDTYSDLRNYLRNTGIRVTSEMKKEIDGYSDIRRSYLGSVKMVNDGTEIDTVYSELVGMYPNLFDATITDSVDQLYEIMDVSDSLKPTFRQMDGVSLNETSAILGRELFDSYFDVALNKPTLADKHKQEISRIKAENRKKIGEVKEKLRADHAEELRATKERYQGRIDRKEEKLLAQKKHHREMQENARNRKTVSTLRRHITKNAGKLREKLMTNTETKHIPATLRGPVLELLLALDFNTGKTARDGGESSFNQRLIKLHSAYVSLLEQEYEYGFTLDEDLKVKLAELKEVTEGKAVRQLDRSELETVDEIVTEILHAVNTANKLFKDGRKADLEEVGTKALTELEQKRKWRRLRVVDENKFPRLISDFINSGNVTPTQMFDRIGGTIQEYYQEVRKGEGNYIRLITKAQDYAHEAMKKYHFKDWGVGKKAKEQTKFKLSGGEVSLTVGELMYIYTASQRTQARAHMVGENAGGITPTSQNEKGIWAEAKESAVKLTEADLDILFAGLTDEQKAFADEMRDYLAKTCAEQGNEVTLAMYGIRKFGEEKYIPIITDPNFLYQKAGVSDDARIKHSGFTKATVQNANTPIQAVDFMDVWAKHVGDMAMYNSFVRQLDDFQRVWNYKVKGEKDKSVKTALEHTLGSRVNGYIKQMLTDINGGVKADPNESLSTQMVSATKKVSVAGNLRVVIQQPSSIGRAFAEINPKYFANLKKVDYAELEKHVPQATLKKMGYFDTDMGGSITQNLIRQDLTDNWKEKAKDLIKNEYGTRDDAFSYLAEKADEITWGVIWNAVKAETQQTTNFKVGSQEYWDRCAERMVEVIDKTQVMDSVFQRSQVMRSKHGLAKMVTAFMSEPTKTYGMIWRAVTKLYDGDKDAWNNLLRTMTAVVFQNILNSAMASMIDAMRNDEDEEYWEKWCEAFVDGLIDAPLSMVPYVRDVVSLFQGYSVKRTDMSIAEDVVKAARTIADEDKTPWEKTVASLRAVSDLTGIPLANLYRDAEAATRMIKDMYEDITGISDYEASFDGRKEAYMADNRLSEGKDTTEYYDLLFESVEQGENEFREMVKYGLEAGRTQSAMYQAINDRFYKKYSLMIWQAVQNYKAGNTAEYNDVVAFFEAQGYSKTNTINKVMGNVLNKINAGKSAPEQVSVDDVVGSYYTEDEINSFENNYDELYEAYAAGDSMSYTEMYTRLKEGGKTDAAIKTAMTTRRRKAVEESEAFQDLITCCITGNGDYTVYYSKLVQSYPIKMPMDEKRADVAELVLRSEIWTKFKEAALADDREGMKKYGRYLAPLTQMSLSELRKKAIK